MVAPPDPNSSTRPLTDEEYQLARWMLENGAPEAQDFIGQLENADATNWRCECGCASFSFQIRGKSPAPPGIHVIGDFVFGNNNALMGIFIFESQGILGGVQIHALSGDVASMLPGIAELRPFPHADA